jgi:hypothetical protein
MHHKIFQITKIQTRNSLILNHKEHKIQIVINKLLKSQKSHKIVKNLVFYLKTKNQIIINRSNRYKKSLGKSKKLIKKAF